jgi:hypothetical protein
MAEHTGLNAFTVREFTVQTPGTIAAFLRGLREALRGLRTFFRRTQYDYVRYNYVGEWHSHPSFAARPSGVDHATMIDIATDASVGATFVVLMVVKLGGDGRVTGSVHTYLPSGRCCESELVLER